MYKNPDELIETELNAKLRTSLYPIINIGEIVFREILEIQSNTFKSIYLKSDLQKLRTCIVYRQFDNDMISDSFPFKCQPLKVNNMEKYVPHLTHGNLILHICYANEGKELPSKADYKRKLSFLNEFTEKQLIYDLEHNSNTIKETPYYGLVTFGGKEDLQFLNLVIPAPGFKSSLRTFDLKHELHDNDIDLNNDLVKAKRVKLRNDILSRLQAGSL